MATPPDKAEGRADGVSQEGGDIAAWMARYGPALRRYFNRRANAADTDDLVQEVFLNLQARSEGAPVENMEAYLFTIARNVLLGRYRSDRKDGMWLHDTLDEARHERDDLSPERILSGKQQYARLVVAILNMPPRTRTAFELHRFQKLSYSAIAARMGISKPAVHDLMQRALDHIAAEWEREP